MIANLFGTHALPVENPLLNYIGVALTLVSGLMFLFAYSRQRDSVGSSGDSSGSDATGSRDSVMENPWAVDRLPRTAVAPKYGSASPTVVTTASGMTTMPAIRQFPSLAAHKINARRPPILTKRKMM